MHIVNWRKLKFISYLIIPLLIITLIVELLDLENIVSRSLKENGYIFIEFYLLISLYFMVFKERVVRYALILAAIFFLLVFGAVYYHSGLEQSNTIFFSTSSLIMVSCSLYFFYLLYRPPFHYKSVFAIPLFWISTGHLFYYIGMFVHLGARYLISKESWDNQDVLIGINLVSNYILYGAYLLAAICQGIFK